MALTVEDGTGLAAADALISTAEFDAYHAAYGTTPTTAPTTDALEGAIRRGSAYIAFGFKFEGTPINGRNQAFPVPATGLIDRYGNEVPSNEVPREIKNAVAEAALVELSSPNSLTTTDTTTTNAAGLVTEKTVKVGPITETTKYSDGGGTNTTTSGGTVPTRVLNWLEGFAVFTSGSTGGANTAFLERA